MKKQLFLLILLIFNLETFAQGFQWARGYGSAAQALILSVDRIGNNYSGGRFDYTSDFDPGPGTFYLTPKRNNGSFISKLDAKGNFKWAIQFEGSTNSGCDVGQISIDSAGYIYITGVFYDTVDFDPGSGTYSLYAGNSGMPRNETYIAKLDSSGNLIWAKSLYFPQPFRNHFLDRLGNIFITGSFRSAVDFDPGPGTYILKSNLTEAFILKLNSSGNFGWVKSTRNLGNGSANGYLISTDPDKNIYISGEFIDSVDFDPGSAKYKLTSKPGALDLFILKLNASGDFLWAKQLSIKANTLNNDIKGNLILTGQFKTNTDFDPDTAKYYLKPRNLASAFILKLSSNGYLTWVKNINTTAKGGVGISNVATDASEAILITGGYVDSIDIDSDTGTFYLNYNEKWKYTITDGDFYVSKMDASGKFVWAKSAASTRWLGGTAIGLDQSGFCYVTGYFKDTVDFNPGAGGYKLSSKNPFSTFILKLDTCRLLPTPGKIKGNTTFCNGSTATFSIDSVKGIKNYFWSVPKGATILKGQFSTSIEVMFGSSSGNVGVASVNYCGYSDPSLIAITINPLPKIASYVSPSNTICSGSSVIITSYGAKTYLWNGGITNGVSFIPDSTFTYGVIGTDANGCANKDSLRIIVNPTPNFFAQPINQKVINGNNATFSVTNSSAKCYYQWQQNSGSGFVTLFNYGPFSGANTKTLVITNVNFSQNNYVYRCVASEGLCSATSNEGELNVVCGLTITEHPQDKTLFEGQVAEFEANSSSLKASYQWQQNKGNGFKNLVTFGQYYGTTSKTLTIDKVALNQNTYNFRCIVTDGVCSDTSDIAKLFVECLINFTKQPQDIIAKAGDNIQFSAETTNLLVSYQWQQNSGSGFNNLANGSQYSGVTSKILIIKNIPFSLDKTEYWCVISNGTCEDTTASAKLSIDCPISISTHPLTKSVNSGSTVKFGISSSLATNYQWQQNSGTGFIDLSDFGQYSGVNTDSLTIKNVSMSQDNYGYRCIAIDGGCSDTSNAAILTVETVGIKKIQSQNIFSIYPNPANNFITIESSQTPNNLPFIITDQIGKQILKGELSNKTNTVDISSLASGFYFLKIGEANKEIFKIMKQ